MDLYDWAGDILSNTLGLDGKACVQRLICELAEVPVNDRSFMGEILHRVIEYVYFIIQIRSNETAIWSVYEVK